MEQNVADISIGKFRLHSCADHLFSYMHSVFLSYKSWPELLKQKKVQAMQYIDGTCQFVGTNFHHQRVWNE